MKEPSFDKQYVIDQLNDPNIKYSIEETYENSQMHIIVKDKYTIFIEEYPNEILCSMYAGEKKMPTMIEFSKEELFEKIKSRINLTPNNE